MLKQKIKKKWKTTNKIRFTTILILAITIPLSIILVSEEGAIGAKGSYVDIGLIRNYIYDISISLIGASASVLLADFIFLKREKSLKEKIRNKAIMGVKLHLQSLISELAKLNEILVCDINEMCSMDFKENEPVGTTITILSYFRENVSASERSKFFREETDKYVDGVFPHLEFYTRKLNEVASLFIDKQRDEELFTNHELEMIRNTCVVYNVRISFVELLHDDNNVLNDFVNFLQEVQRCCNKIPEFDAIM